MIRRIFFSDSGRAGRLGATGRSTPDHHGGSMTDTAYHRISARAAGAPSGCPVDHTFTPLDPAYVADPYPIANEFRERTPVVYAEPLGFVVVTDMDLVTEVFMNPDVYSSANVQDPVFPLSEQAVQAVLAAPDYNPIAVMSNRARSPTTPASGSTPASGASPTGT